MDGKHGQATVDVSCARLKAMMPSEKDALKRISLLITASPETEQTLKSFLRSPNMYAESEVYAHRMLDAIEIARASETCCFPSNLPLEKRRENLLSVRSDAEAYLQKLERSRSPEVEGPSVRKVAAICRTFLEMTQEVCTQEADKYTNT